MRTSGQYIAGRNKCPASIAKGMRPVVISEGTEGSSNSGSGSSSLNPMKITVKIIPETSANFADLIPFSDKNQMPWLVSSSSNVRKPACSDQNSQQGRPRSQRMDGNESAAPAVP